MSEGTATAIGGFNALDRLNGAMRRGDIAFALALVCILVALILPMPKMLLDISLAISITLSVLILMTSLFIERPLEFSSFPTVLLVTTMLRLALNVASTRLILSHGHEGTHAAGEVIKAFGGFIMGGNFIIGVIVFAILVIVNFVVITKGSGRIAEVSARFSLDAMPGKQMAVDADLSSGLIDEAEARKRRKMLEEETSFFGSMDGAAKFVRGDAIAGLLITFINVIAGIIIGVAQNSMSLADAAHTYTLLTVGDGLVSQIPALIVSTAAGMLVSKSGIQGSAEKALFSQMSAYPAALGLSSFLMAALAILPGIPMLPFLVLSVITGLVAWNITQKQENKALEEVQEEQKKLVDAKAQEANDEPISNVLQMDDIRIEMGYGLLPLINSEKGQRLTDQIKAMRKQLAGDMGFVMPAVRLLDNLQLNPTEYVIRIKEIEAGRGDLRPFSLLVMDPMGNSIPLDGEPTIEPTFGLPAMWIQPNLRPQAEERGYTIVESNTVLTTHLTESVKDHMDELLSYVETQKLLDGLEKPHQKLIADMIPAQLPMSALQRVLQNLLMERVSIRDLPTILEGISEACGFTRHVTSITEHVRTRLSRQITNSHLNREGVLPILSLTPEWEEIFNEGLIGEGENRQLAVAPSLLHDFINKVKVAVETQAMAGEVPVLMTSANIRPFIRSVIERFKSTITVMSQNEVHPKAKVRTVGQI